MKPEPTIAYWAGVFDAAGCIRMKVTASLPAPYISLRSKSATLPRALQRAWGGGVRRERSGTIVWQTSHTRAQAIALSLSQHMRTPLDPRITAWVPGTRGRKRTPGVRRVNLMGGE